MVDSEANTQEEASAKPIALEEARLQIGDLINLQAQLSDRVERYSVRLLGMAKGRSVLVTTPMVDGHYLLMREGQSLILRAFSGKSAYAFPTQILKTVNTPYPYLHLAYPREVRSLVVRKGARANVNVICAITHCDGAPMQAAVALVNMSVGGALMIAKNAPGKKGQHLGITFKVMLNGIEALLELDTVIRAVSYEQGGDAAMPYQIGIQFVDVSPENSIPLLAFVYQALLEQSPGA